MALRERMFLTNPLCAHCLEAGIVRVWEELDHIVPLFQGGTNDESNLAGLCRECHNKKSQKERGRTVSVQIGLDGYPVDEP
jgi:5-methylcytosine-specific restriction protein A